MKSASVVLATFVIGFAAVADFAQERKRTARPGMVQTVRIERRQLLAVTYHQHGVMVSTNISDEHGRALESAEYLPGGNPDTKVTSTYDEHGNEIEHAYYTHGELTHRSTTRYDSRNRKVELQHFNIDGTPGEKFIYQYDRFGRQTELKVRADGGTLRHSVTTFDRHGRELERREYRGDGTPEGRYVFRYDNAGNKLSETHYYTQNGRKRSTRENYTYDRNGQLTVSSLYFDGVLNKETTYKRDARGNPTEIIEIGDKFQLVEKRAFSYEFDAEGNVTRAIVSEWTDKAPHVPLQPTFEIRRIYGSVTTATFALWSAVEEPDEAEVAALLKQGAEVNAHHPDGGTALIKASTRGRVKVVQTLLAAGAKVDDKDAEGWTALMWAAEFGEPDTVEVLLKAGADPNARTELGGVAIMPAALKSEMDVLKLLLEKGANVNAATNDGVTTLMLAATRNDLDVLKLLLERGADVNAKSKAGETALSIAIAANNNAAADLLRKAGAK